MTSFNNLPSPSLVTRPKFNASFIVVSLGQAPRDYFHCFLIATLRHTRNHVCLCSSIMPEIVWWHHQPTVRTLMYGSKMMLVLLIACTLIACSLSSHRNNEWSFVVTFFTQVFSCFKWTLKLITSAQVVCSKWTRGKISSSNVLRSQERVHFLSHCWIAVL